MKMTMQRFFLSAALSAIYSAAMLYPAVADHHHYRGHYSSDAALQLIAMGIGFGIGVFTRRPLLWGTLVSICMIAASIQIASISNSFIVPRLLFKLGP
jgi:hypothetical protein